MYEVAAILSKRYRDFNHYNRKNPLDELLFILCSVKRTEKVYLRAYRSLKKAFPRFEDLAEAKTKDLIKKVEWGGLQNQKASSVKALIGAVIDTFGQLSLAKLKHLDDQECEEFLLALPGVGKKVARCVMLYSLERKMFPVDSHCWQIAARLGWINSSGNNRNCSVRDMDRLQEMVPPDLRYSLHVNLVSLGREICTARKPRCRECVIFSFCRRIGAEEACQAVAKACTPPNTKRKQQSNKLS